MAAIQAAIPAQQAVAAVDQLLGKMVRFKRKIELLVWLQGFQRINKRMAISPPQHFQVCEAQSNQYSILFPLGHVLNIIRSSLNRTFSRDSGRGVG